MLASKRFVFLIGLWLFNSFAIGNPATTPLDKLDFQKPFTVPQVPQGAALGGTVVLYSSAAGTLKSPQPHDSIERENRKETDDHQLAVSTVTLADATIALAILTAIIAVTAVVQIWMLIKQLKLTEAADRHAKTAADAARASADAATASAEAIPKIEKAYLFVRVSITNFMMNPNDGLAHGKVTVRIHNHGKTPASLTSIRSYVDYLLEAPQAFVARKDSEYKIPDGLVVAANDHLDWPIPLAITQELFLEIKTLTKTMYCVGQVDYEDVLGESRSTGFCWYNISIGTAFPQSFLAETPLNFRT
jgi:hypothetical protein